MKRLKQISAVIAVVFTIWWLAQHSTAPLGLAIPISALIGYGFGMTWWYFWGPRGDNKKEMTMNRRRLLGLVWAAVVLGVCAMTLLAYPKPGPPLGIGDTGWFELVNITEVDFFEHFPRGEWIAYEKQTNSDD